MDMHIHDVDIVQWLFGLPEAVSALGLNVIEGSGIDSICAHYRYPGYNISLRSSWAYQGDGIRFQDGYEVSFERGTVVYSRNSGTTVYEIGVQPKSYPINDIGEPDCYLEEIKSFIRTLEGGQDSRAEDTVQASNAIKLTILERESAMNKGSWIELSDGR